MAVAIFALQRGDPVHPEARVLVAAMGGPERDIGLLLQVFARPVIRPVIDDEEVVHPQIAVIAQEIGQADAFVPQGGEEEDAVAPDRARAVDDRRHFTPLGPGAQV